MGSASLLDRILSARAAVLANVALVLTGAALALASLIDPVTGAIVVLIGLAGAVVSSLGYRADGEE